MNEKYILCRIEGIRSTTHAFEVFCRKFGAKTDSNISTKLGHGIVRVWVKEESSLVIEKINLKAKKIGAKSVSGEKTNNGWGQITSGVGIYTEIIYFNSFQIS
ncbi:MAG: hypothetical protein AAB876_03275 [Patescibacteria group bacterium]